MYEVEFEIVKRIDFDPILDDDNYTIRHSNIHGCWNDPNPASDTDELHSCNPFIRTNQGKTHSKHQKTNNATIVTNLQLDEKGEWDIFAHVFFYDSDNIRNDIILTMTVVVKDQYQTSCEQDDLRYDCFSLKATYMKDLPLVVLQKDAIPIDVILLGSNTLSYNVVGGLDIPIATMNLCKGSREQCQSDSFEKSMDIVLDRQQNDFMFNTSLTFGETER
eukprot:Awhi_evm1s1589